MHAKNWEKIFTGLFWLAGAIVFLVLLGFIGNILYKGLPVLSWHFISSKAQELQAGGGVAGQFFNSFYILLISMGLALPLAVGAGIYLALYAPKNQATYLLRLSIECLASIPSIVLGLFGMIIFVNFFGFGFSILSGGLTLLLLNLPMLVRVTEEAINTVPKTYFEASIALGATKWQSIWQVVLPAALSNILTGVTLTAGRALGETAILIFTAGTSVSRRIGDLDPLAGGGTLAVHMWYVSTTGLVADRTEIASGIGALLLVIILALNLGLLIPKKLLQANKQA